MKSALKALALLFWLLAMRKLGLIAMNLHYFSGGELNFSHTPVINVLNFVSIWELSTIAVTGLFLAIKYKNQYTVYDWIASITAIALYFIIQAFLEPINWTDTTVLNYSISLILFIFVMILSLSASKRY